MIPPSRFEFASRGCLSGRRARDFPARGEHSGVRRNDFAARWNRSHTPSSHSAARPAGLAVPTGHRSVRPDTALGIEGAEQAGPDLMTLQPEIKVMAGGSEVKVSWSWQGQRAFIDAIEIEVDRGTGWKMLTIDTTPNYHTPNPSPPPPPAGNTAPSIESVINAWGSGVMRWG